MADRNGNHALSLFKLDFSVKELLGFAEIGGRGARGFHVGSVPESTFRGAIIKIARRIDSDC